MEHILDAPKEMKRIWNGKLGEKSPFANIAAEPMLKGGSASVEQVGPEVTAVSSVAVRLNG